MLSVLALTLYFGRAFDARRMPDLGPEYRVEFEHEFDASLEQQTDWTDYLALEDLLAAELAEQISGAERPDSEVDRYSADSHTSPANYDGNWNRSYEIAAPSPRGVAVLIHGLTDSPYTMLSTAQTLVGEGYSVVVPRIPGHGFAVGALLQTRWEDWAAAVRIAVRHANQLNASGQPLLMIGYSNGGLMAVDYALQCDQLDDLPCPAALILLSPAIAVSSAAIVTNWHSAISWLPYFEKFRWLSILPEVDPFKFTSFPKRAAWEIYRLSTRTFEQLNRPAEVAKLPPILTFQSVIDNTISAEAVVTALYSKLDANGSQLVVYDINRNSTIGHLMKTNPGDIEEYFLSQAPLQYGVTIVGNRNQQTYEVDSVILPALAMEMQPGSLRSSWPRGMYSLSHIGVPFRPDDQVYGDGNFAEPDADRVMFGALAPRGEPGILLLTSDYFLRARYNPFYNYQARRISEWLEQL